MSILTRGERLLLWKFITIPSKPPVFKKKISVILFSFLVEEVTAAIKRIATLALATL